MLSKIQIRSFILLSVFLSNICCVESTSSSISQQITNEIHYQVEDSNFIEINPLQEIVNTYCQLAKDGKYDKLKNLVTTYSDKDINEKFSRNKKSNGDAPDNKILDELNNSLLTKSIPELIYTGKMKVERMKTISVKKNLGEVYTILQSQKFEPERTAIIFRLKKEGKQWKIYDAGYSGLDS